MITGSDKTVKYAEYPDQFLTGIFRNLFRAAMILSVVILSGCGSKNNETPVSVYLIDNGGTCDPCSQIRYVSSQIEKELQKRHLSQWSGKIATIRTDRNEEPKLREKCRVFKRELLVTFAPKGTVKAYRIFSLEDAVINPYNSPTIITETADQITQFADSCRGKQ